MSRTQRQTCHCGGNFSTRADVDPSRRSRRSRAPASSEERRAAVRRELLSSGDGAVGYLLKDRVTDVRTFIDAVREVAAGGTVLDRKVVSASWPAPTGTPRRPG